MLLPLLNRAAQGSPKVGGLPGSRAEGGNQRNSFELCGQERASWKAKELESLRMANKKQDDTLQHTVNSEEYLI